jgi:DNA polymerase III subunit beta
MYVQIMKDDIIEGLQKSANIIPTKTGAAFLRTIWLQAEEEELRIMATDSNIEFRGAYPAEVTEGGLAGVHGRSFCDLLRKLPPGKIVLKTDRETGSLLIEQGRRKYRLPTNDPSWFQNFAEFPDEGGVFWSGDFLQDIIDRILFCISDEDSREAIACMSIKPAQDDSNIEVCGLNLHQFAMIRFPHEELHGTLPEEGILVQRKYIGELRKWLTVDEIELAISDKRFFFRSGDKKELFSLPLSYYQYPDYQNFLSKLESPEVSTLEADRLELADALERLVIFNSENNRCTYFDFQGEELVLSSQGQDVGSATETLDGSYSGGLEKIAFPTKNLMEILGHYKSEKLRFTLTGMEGPCGIYGEKDQDYSVIVMPMKIVEETYYSEEDI